METFLVDAQKLGAPAGNSQRQEKEKLVICLLELFSQDLIVINVASYLDLAKRGKHPVLLDVSEGGQPKVIHKHIQADILNALYCGYIIPPLLKSGVEQGHVNELYSKLGSLVSTSLLGSQSNLSGTPSGAFSSSPLTSFSQPSTHSFLQPAPLPSSLHHPALAPTLPEQASTRSSTLLLFSVSIPLSSTLSDREQVLSADDVNLCTVFGCWLQYPAVYWFNTEKGHCLDMEKLTQYVVEAEDCIPANKEVWLLLRMS